MFQFTDDLRGNLFIQIPGFYFEYKLWRELPLASKAILPVIYKHMNAWGGCYPSQQTIAILAGITEKTAREGLKGLDGLHGFCKKNMRHGVGVLPTNIPQKIFLIIKKLFQSVTLFSMEGIGVN